MTESKPPTRGSFTVKDDAPQQKYYGSIPHMVWNLGLHPLHITVYAYLVRVAGKHGVCWQSTKTIAAATRISAGKISEARKVLETARLIKITKPGAAGRGHSYEIVIPNLWAINIGYIDKDPKCVAQVKAMAEKVHAMKFYKKTSPHEPKTSPHEPKTSPHEPKKNTEEEHLKEGESKDANSRRPSRRSSKSTTALRGKATPPKRVLAGTGDPQRDRVDSAAAGTSAVQAKELVARAMYQLVTEDLEYPEGKTKAAKSARYPAEKAADSVLEQIGRTNYQEALDACYALMTNPTPEEHKWLKQVQRPGGIVGTVTKRVSQLRGAARKRAAAMERNRSILDIPVYLDPEMDPNTVGMVRIGRIVNIGPDVPHECADIWREALEDMELQSGHPETLLRRAVLQEVTGDTWIIDLNNQVNIEWARIKLKPAVERTLALVAGRPMQVSFVARNGAGNGNQDED